MTFVGVPGGIGGDQCFPVFEANGGAGQKPAEAPGDETPVTWQVQF